MNAYKLHGQGSTLLISIICKHLGIGWSQIYKALKDIDRNTGIIETKDGRKFKVVLEEIEPEIPEEVECNNCGYRMSLSRDETIYICCNPECTSYYDDNGD